MSKHWQGARVRMLEKLYMFVRLGVKKVSQNEERNIENKKKEKRRTMEPAWS